MAGQRFSEELKKSIVHLYISGKTMQEIEIEHGWAYLASVMDLCTRKIIGWSFYLQMKTIY